MLRNCFRSPALLPKPVDWPGCIDVCGFAFSLQDPITSLQTTLVAFLKEGPPPIYVGFGSIVVDSPRKLTEIVFRVIQKTGQRAIVSKGWGGLGGDGHDIPENIFLVGSCPHDWLFLVSCIMAEPGLLLWALNWDARQSLCHSSATNRSGGLRRPGGVEPAPIPYKELTADTLANAIREAL